MQVTCRVVLGGKNKNKQRQKKENKPETEKGGVLWDKKH